MSTRPASENVFDTLRMAEAAAPPTPPSTQTVIYTKSDGRIYWKDDAGTEYSVASLADLGGSVALDDLSDVATAGATTGDVLTYNGSSWAPDAPAGGGALDDLSDVATAGQTTGDVLTYNGSSWVPDAPTGGGATDPIEAEFGTPDTAFEFASSSLTGLTTFGTPDVLDADTIVTGHLLIADDDSTHAGVYAAASGACTLVAKLSDFVAYENYQRVGAFVGEATPGKIEHIALLGGASPWLKLEQWNPFSSGSPTNVSITRMPSDPIGFTPWWFGIRVASSTDISYYVSRSGVVWTPLLLSRNPSFTVGSFGLSVANYAGGSQPRAAGAYDYMRIWNSAKTFPSFS